MKILKSLLAIAVAFLIIDLAWISLFLGDVYAAQLGSMMRSPPSAAAAAAFYLGYVAAIFFLAVRPGLRRQHIGTAAGHGAALGATAYGTYTLTNYAIFSQWSVLLVVSDVAWGAFLTALSACAGYLAARK